MRHKIDPAIVKENLTYNPETGEFLWATARKGRIVQRRAGNLHKSTGYRRICLNGINYVEHRLAWVWMTGNDPELEVDHINRIRNDNRWSNLRLADRTENTLNSSIKKSNSSGVVGVSWDKQRSKWVAQARVAGKKRNLGRYDTKEDAVKAWRSAVVNDKPEFRFSG